MGSDKDSQIRNEYIRGTLKFDMFRQKTECQTVKAEMAWSCETLE